MTGAALLPIAGLAGVSLGRAAAVAIGEGLSFAAELTRGLSTAGETTAADSRAASEFSLGRLQRKIEALAQRIQQQLEAAGIKLSEPLTLTSDRLGGITAGQHPQRASIESLLESDVLLLRDFDQLQDEYVATAASDSSLPEDFQLVVSKAGGSNHR